MGLDRPALLRLQLRALIAAAGGRELRIMFPLVATVEEFRAEEAEHRDTALQNGAEQAPGYRLLSSAIKAGCRVAIKLSEKI